MLPRSFRAYCITLALLYAVIFVALFSGIRALLATIVLELLFAAYWYRQGWGFHGE